MTTPEDAKVSIFQEYHELEQRVIDGLDCIFSLLREPLWPRTISTKATNGRQVRIWSKQEAMAWFKAANFVDCRICALPIS